MIAMSKNALIKYHLRLGDVLRSLPLAEKLCEDGYAVTFECNEEYHSLFDRVPYAMPALPGEYEPENFNLFIDLQVWPKRYDAYRMSGLRWSEFVLGEYMEIGETDPIPSLQYNLNLNVKPYQLCSPFSISGESQKTAFFPSVDMRRFILAAQHQAHKVDPKSVIVAKDIPQLIDLIANASWFGTVNSAPTVIASAVRDSYTHIVGSMITDDYNTEKQERLML